MNKWIYSKTGQVHQERHEKCQDAVLFQENEWVYAAAVSDGASGCRYGREGAKTACKAAISYLTEEDVIGDHFSNEKLAWLFNEYLLYRLEQTALKQGNPVDEYASTVAAVCLNRPERKAAAISLGDSAVLRIRNQNVETFLGARRTGGQPCLLTDAKAHDEMQVRYFDLCAEDTIVLCTDGFLDAYTENSRLRSAMKNLDFQKMNAILDTCSNADDVSYIAISGS